MTQHIAKSHLALLFAEALALVVVLVLGMWQLGTADGLRFAAAMAVAYLVPRVVLSRARGTSDAAVAALLVIAMVMAIYAVALMSDWTKTPGYSLEMPNLRGDDRNYYKWALNRYDGRVEEPRVVFPGFPQMMVVLWRVLGVSVIWPVAMNAMFALLGITFTGMATRRLLHARISVAQRVLLAVGVGSCVLLMFMLASGVMVLKEAITLFGIASVGYVLTGMDCGDDEGITWRDWLVLVLALALLALVRTTYLYFVMIGIVMMAVAHWRRNWLLAVGMLALTLVAFMAGNHYAAYSVRNHLVIIDGGWDMQHFYLLDSHQHPYLSIIGNYFLLPEWKRVLMLPLTMAVQFIIPFPWIAYDEYILVNIMPRISYGWYALGGVALFYYLIMSWRRRSQARLGLWAWWPAVSFAVAAYVTAGSVVRYVLPFEAMFVPVVVFVLSRVREGYYRRHFVWWAVAYVLMLSVTLLVCLQVQTGVVTRILHGWGLM